MSEINIELNEDADGEIAKRISEGLVAFNNSIVGPSNRKNIIIAAKSSSGEIIGGIKADTHRGWLYIHQLWVSEQHRAHRLGSKLMDMAEDEARKRSCRAVYLDTFSFQALDFYKKRGYEVFGELDNFPIGHKRFFLTKTL